MLLALAIFYKILQELVVICKGGEQMIYFCLDFKLQVMIEYVDDNIFQCIDIIVVFIQYDDFDEDECMLNKICEDIIKIVILWVKVQFKFELQKLFDENIIYYINLIGKFVIGGLYGDVGLMGCKIIVDIYGGKGVYGGGVFFGKDFFKVDCFVAYVICYIVKNFVVVGVCDEVLVQVFYVIGVVVFINIYVNIYGIVNVKMSDGEIVKKVEEVFDMCFYVIEQCLKFCILIYFEFVVYGYMGCILE